MKQWAYFEHALVRAELLILGYLPQFLLGCAVLFLSVLWARKARRMCLNLKASTVQPEIIRLIASMVFFFVVVFGSFAALQILGLAPLVTKLLAGAGILGIIAGFAFKDLASNLFAGLLLKAQRPFKEGDWVEIGTAYGVVDAVGWITTAIDTVTGQVVFIPNQVIYNSAFTNYSAFHKRRIVFTAGVSYGDDLAQVQQAALEEVQGLPGLVENERVDFFYTEIGSYSYNFELRFWIHFRDNNDYRRALSEIIMRIKKRFEREKIDLAYPVTTLDFGVKGGVNLFDRPLALREVSPEKPLQ